MQQQSYLIPESTPRTTEPYWGWSVGLKSDPAKSLALAVDYHRRRYRRALDSVTVNSATAAALADVPLAVMVDDAVPNRALYFTRGDVLDGGN